MLATNAVSVSSFSAAQCVKMLNDVSAASEPFDALEHALMASIILVDVANDFIASNDHMKHMFGTKFKLSDQLWVIVH